MYGSTLGNVDGNTNLTTNTGASWSPKYHATNLQSDGVTLPKIGVTGFGGDTESVTLASTTKIWMIMQDAWPSVDVTGWTYVATGEYLTGGYTSLKLYHRTYSASTFTLDAMVALYLFEAIPATYYLRYKATDAAGNDTPNDADHYLTVTVSS